MLALPMRPQDPSPQRHLQDPYMTSLPARHQEHSPHPPDLRTQVADAMLSIMPSTRPSAPKRPKLSLQTTLPSSIPTPQRSTTAMLALPLSATDSPTARNTHANTFDAPPPTPSSTTQLHPEISFPSASTASSTQSPFPHTEPYILPIGTHSILRNSPLPKRHLSATQSGRTPRRMFAPIKRVAFQEEVMVAPTPVVVVVAGWSEGEEGDEEGTEESEEEQRMRREIIEAEDGHGSAPAVVGRRKRRREWVWRPIDGEGDDDVMGFHAPDRLSGEAEPESETPLSARSPAISVIEKEDYGTGRRLSESSDVSSNISMV